MSHSACRAITTARSPIISTVSASSTAHGGAAAEPARSLALVPAAPAARHQGEWPDWAPSPFTDRPPARVEGAACRVSYVGHASLADPDRRSQHPARSGLVGARVAVPLTSGRNGSTIPASRSPTCRRSTSCWCRTPTTIISMSRRCRGSPPRIVRASSRRSAMTRSCAITIRRSRPKRFDWDDRVDLGAAWR